MRRYFVTSANSLVLGIDIRSFIDIWGMFLYLPTTLLEPKVDGNSQSPGPAGLRNDKPLFKDLVD